MDYNLHQYNQSLNDIALNPTNNPDIHGTNNFMESFLNPTIGHSKLPTGGNVPSVVKHIPYNEVFTIDNETAGIGGYLFTFMPQNQVSPAGIFKYNAISQRYHYIRDIELSEVLYNSFVRSRVVSGCFSAYSDTQPGGNLNIAGRFNSVIINSLPLAFTGLNYQTAQRYRYHNNALRANVPILCGVYSLMPISDEHRFRTLSPFLYSTANFMFFDYVNNIEEGTTPFFPQSNITEVDSELFSVNYTNLTDPNFDTRASSLWTTLGKWTVSFVLSCPVVTRIRKLSITFYTDEMVNGLFVTDRTQQIITVNSDLTAYSFETTQNFPAGLRGISISAEGTAVSTGFVLLVKATRLDETTEGMFGPVSLHFLDGAYHGTNVAITGCINYECIPNALLIQNLKVSYSLDDPLTDLSAVRHLAIVMADHGYAFTFTRPEYYALINSLDIGLYQRSQHYGYASVMSRIAMAFKKVAPYLRSAGMAIKDEYKRQHGSSSSHALPLGYSSSTQQDIELGSYTAGNVHPTTGESSKVMIGYSSNLPHTGPVFTGEIMSYPGLINKNKGKKVNKQISLLDRLEKINSVPAVVEGVIPKYRVAFAADKFASMPGLKVQGKLDGLKNIAKAFQPAELARLAFQAIPGENCVFEGNNRKFPIITSDGRDITGHVIITNDPYAPNGDLQGKQTSLITHDNPDDDQGNPSVFQLIAITTTEIEPQFKVQLQMAIKTFLDVSSESYEGVYYLNICCVTEPVDITGSSFFLCVLALLFGLDPKFHYTGVVGFDPRLYNICATGSVNMLEKKIGRLQLRICTEAASVSSAIQICKTNAECMAQFGVFFDTTTPYQVTTDLTTYIATDYMAYAATQGSGGQTDSVAYQELIKQVSNLQTENSTLTRRLEDLQQSGTQGIDTESRDAYVKMKQEGKRQREWLIEHQYDYALTAALTNPFPGLVMKKNKLQLFTQMRDLQLRSNPATLDEIKVYAQSFEWFYKELLKYRKVADPIFRDNALLSSQLYNFGDTIRKINGNGRNLTKDQVASTLSNAMMYLTCGDQYSFVQASGIPVLVASFVPEIRPTPELLLGLMIFNMSSGKLIHGSIKRAVAALLQAKPNFSYDFYTINKQSLSDYIGKDKDPSIYHVRVQAMDEDLKEYILGQIADTAKPSAVFGQQQLEDVLTADPEQDKIDRQKKTIQDMQYKLDNPNAKKKKVKAEAQQPVRYEQVSEYQPSSFIPSGNYGPVQKKKKAPIKQEYRYQQKGKSPTPEKEYPSDEIRQEPKPSYKSTFEFKAAPKDLNVMFGDLAK